MTHAIIKYIRTSKLVTLTGIVTSETDPRKSYTVHYDGRFWSCECESRQYPCKHVAFVKQKEIEAAQRNN
jgi:membrane protein implicated in regulation of membrane protease activity